VQSLLFHSIAPYLELQRAIILYASQTNSTLITYAVLHPQYVQQHTDNSILVITKGHIYTSLFIVQVETKTYMQTYKKNIK